ncbi:MAG: PP2C family protein-serine/threonine phosphatase [Frankiaceae bacterium]
MTKPIARTAAADVGAGLEGAERAIAELLSEAHVLAAYELPGAIARYAERLGVRRGLLYLADLQQIVLVPFLGPEGPAFDEQLEALGVDSTLAGRAYQHVEIHTHDLPDGGTRVWLPLLDGSDRLGVLTVTVPENADLAAGGVLLGRLRLLASLAAELVMTKTMYGDTVVRLRRRKAMGLASEMQWSLMPPLTFACGEVTIAAALEPAYQVAGDTVDYAVDPSYARIGIFDGMGHGLQSAQLASLAVAAYRNARRSGRPLTDIAHSIDTALLAGFGGEVFTTAVLAELNTETGLLEWVNAGHPEPLLLRSGRMVKSLHTDPGLPLGLDPVAAGTHIWQVAAERLEPGDRVLFYTDGVTEARSPDAEFFGVQRLTDLLIRHLAAGLNTPETMRRIVRTLLEHQQGQLTDDATLLLLEWRTGKEQLLLP